jgi:hypothetical protein
VVKIPVDMQVAIDPEKETISISLYDIPLEHIEGILRNMGEESWRQNILDGINGARAAKDLGIAYTERSFRVRSEAED